jgi:hypothetical protein
MYYIASVLHKKNYTHTFDIGVTVEKTAPMIYVRRRFPVEWDVQIGELTRTEYLAYKNGKTKVIGTLAENATQIYHEVRLGNQTTGIEKEVLARFPDRTVTVKFL